jgi:hypothetical protein
MTDRFQQRALERLVDEATALRRRGRDRREAEKKACADRGYVRKNVYLCDKCGAGWISVDLDEGVTPFMDLCPICEESLGTSLMYQIPDSIVGHKPARVEWRKPTPDEVREASPGRQMHYENGGLHRVVAVSHSEKPIDPALKAAVKRLRALERWFDTDTEILDAMDPDTRADNERQLRLIRETLDQITGGHRV